MTPEQYFSPENKAISNSKVSDFLKSKEYYHAKHVARTLVEEPTAAMQLGKMIDLAFSAGTADEIHKHYEVKVLKKDDPERYEAQKGMDPERIVTDTVMEKALAMSEAVLREPFYKWYAGRKCETQKPIFGTIEDGGKKIDICGLPDMVVDEPDILYIDDLKTSSAAHMRTPAAWYWHCLDYGYLRQLAIYKFIKQQQNPGRKIVCRHIAVCSQKNGRYAVKLFVIPDHLLIPAFYDFGVAAIAITNEKDWKDDPIDWNQAAVLEEPPRRTERAEDEEEAEDDAM